MKKVCVLVFLLLEACCSSTLPTYFMFEKTPRTEVRIDPDPLCHIKYSEDTLKLLDRALSSDPFDLYQGRYETQVPYRHPEWVQQEQLPVESFTIRCPRL